MSAWGQNRYAPLSGDWYNHRTKREVQQDRRMADLEKKLGALLKTSQTPAARAQNKPNRNMGTCSEKPSNDTMWICAHCTCPHSNANKLVCRWCGIKRAATPAMSIPPPASGGSAHSAGSLSASASCPSVLLPVITPGPIDKPWMKRVLASAPSADSTGAPICLDSPNTALLDASADKRAQLENMLSSAKSSGLGDELIKHIQADLDSLPAPQSSSQLQEAGRLYQEKAKQEKHFSSQLALLDTQVENIHVL